MPSLARPRPIRESDDVSAFDCNEPSLDDYLRRRAWANHARGASRCFVTTRRNDAGSRLVVGYYALAAASVQRQDLTGPLRRNMPEHVPVILLSRLAVDVKEQGNGIGRHLLRDAILRTVQVAEQIGVRALLVHALHDDARDFYRRFEFEPSPTDDLHLLLRIEDARQAIGFSAHI